MDKSLKLIRAGGNQLELVYETAILGLVALVLAAAAQNLVLTFMVVVVAVAVLARRRLNLSFTSPVGWWQVIWPLLGLESLIILGFLAGGSFSLWLMVIVGAVWYFCLNDSASYRGERALFNALGLILVTSAALCLAYVSWNLPVATLVAGVWGTSYLIGYLLAPTLGQPSNRLAAAWALVAVEIIWVLSRWVVSYKLFGTGILLPQASIVLAGVGYLFGGLLVAHKDKRLTRRLVAEYLIIEALIFIIVIVLTRWTNRI